MRNKIVALDFDGTVCVHRFPEIGEISEQNQRVIDYIRKVKAAGGIIILWTCREDTVQRKYLSEAIQWCKEHDIPIDYVNRNANVDFYGFASRKIMADEYIDDKAINISMF